MIFWWRKIHRLKLYAKSLYKFFLPLSLGLLIAWFLCAPSAESIWKNISRSSYCEMLFFKSSEVSVLSSKNFTHNMSNGIWLGRKEVTKRWKWFKKKKASQMYKWQPKSLLSYLKPKKQQQKANIKRSQWLDRTSRGPLIQFSPRSNHPVGCLSHFEVFQGFTNQLWARNSKQSLSKACDQSQRFISAVEILFFFCTFSKHGE